MDDIALLKRAAEALAEIDRTDGLIDPHADVLTALRIRLEGGPRKSLEEMMKTTESMRGKKKLEDAMKEKTQTNEDLADLMSKPEDKKKKSLDDLL